MGKSYYKMAEAALKKDIGQLRTKKGEAKKLQAILQEFYTIKSSPNIKTDYLSEKDYDEIIKFVEEITGAAIDKTTLSVANETKFVSEGSADSTIEPLKGLVHNDGTITVQPKQLERVVTRIKLLQNSNEVDNTTLKEIEKILKEVENLEAYTKARGRTSTKISQDLVNRLNNLYSRVNVSVLKQQIGKIGEYFAGAAVAAANAKINNYTGEILNYLKWNLGNNTIKNIGDEKTYHYQASFEEENNGVRISTHAVDDKVDMQVDLLGKTINMSVKNYQNISNITIFNGNLLSLLAQKHYNNLLRSYARGEYGDSEEVYRMLRKICFIKALAGGVLAMDKTGNLLTTPTAKYLVVNEQGEAWHVWSMYDIIQKYDKNEALVKFKPDFPKASSTLLNQNRTQYNSQLFSSHISLYTKQL